MPETAVLHLLDVALRGGLITLLAFAAALLLRDHGRATAGRCGAALALGVAVYALYGLPDLAAPARMAWQAPLAVVSAGNSVLLWIFASALFNDRFELRWWHGAAWATLAAVGLAGCFVSAPAHVPWHGAAALFLNLAPIGFALLAVGQSLSSWHADLVEERRRLRVFIIGAAAAYTLVSAAGKLGAQRGSVPAALADALCLALVTAAILWRLVRVHGWDLFPDDPARLPADIPAPVTPAASDTAALDDSAPGNPAGEAVDAVLVAALDKLLTRDRIYREENLTIGGLAARLDLPEYRLRRLINQGLGHRNFNAFLNRYRIDEARQALADPGRAAAPVLTLAMDCGFQSLGPFNRAFKAETGLTPTAYRRLHAQLRDNPATDGGTGINVRPATAYHRQPAHSPRDREEERSE